MNKANFIIKYLLVITLLICFNLIKISLQAQNIRTTISLNNNWKTIAFDSVTNQIDGFQNRLFNDSNWKQVTVPHTWDTYEGYRRMRHGNRHGYAFYRTTFSINNKQTNKRFFLFFEGVGSYATIWLNNKKVGYHAGGRTTFTIDVTDAIYKGGSKNYLAVRADHPAYIQDLPWVCGGCSDERGFSEGSQPMGIFRPVQLIVTNEIRIEPFGVHVWNDSTATTTSAKLNIETEIKNYVSISKNIIVVNKLMDKNGAIISTSTNNKNIVANSNLIVSQQLQIINNPHLWSLENPYLYHLISEIYEGGKLIDQTITDYGIRTISWPIGKLNQKQFLLNGKPVFINGIAEYEHQIGNSHAFTNEEIHTRAMMVKAGGFNAFRDAHQPHNLRYQNYWDSLGILWWPQLSAHIWYDTPEFKSNFKTLLKDWIKERRNSPSVILWGLQNESKLPKDFAQECSQLIREMDPTASSQRKITTCNGGEGTDWDVPQNWTGTYGGNPATYSEDVKRQVLIGEYGAWRTLDLHTEGGFQQNGILSEDRMTQLMETKVKLAEYVKDSVAGQFFWLLTSHDNPGRVQGGEGYRELDKIGPVNYKGLFTPWEEPLDVFYMFRSNYAPKETEPMVYIVSHTWPSRWLKHGKKDSIIVYSNCDEVELFNDVNNISLGRKKRGVGISHFQWDDVDINYNILYAVGYVNAKAVTKDLIVLNHLKKAPHLNDLNKNAMPLYPEGEITKPKNNYNYLYRVNCGGPDYKDVNGNNWLADRALTNDKSWGSVSWANDFAGIPPFFASQRKISSPIAGTKDWPLFQSFRYGRDKLKFQFPVPDGDYLIELYFTEPWLGVGGGMDCTAWRQFDVAINNKTVIKDLDIWKECYLRNKLNGNEQIISGTNTALKKSIIAHITGGKLEISFPHISSGQAIVSAIAIASLNKQLKPVPASKTLIQNISLNNKIKNKITDFSVQEWMDNGNKQSSDSEIQFSALPPMLFGAEWLQLPSRFFSTVDNNTIQFTVTEKSNVFVAVQDSFNKQPFGLKDFVDTKTMLETDEHGGTKYAVFRKSVEKGATVVLNERQISIHGKYIIAVTPASNIEPAYDLKPAITYKAPQATLSGAGLVKTTINEKESVLFNNNQSDTIAWKISIGAADVYSLSIKYANPTNKKLIGKLEVLAADGTVMKTSSVAFIPSKTGKWNYIDSTTGTMINAGNYIIRLSAADANGLGISGLDVQ